MVKAPGAELFQNACGVVNVQKLFCSDQSVFSRYIHIYIYIYIYIYICISRPLCSNPTNHWVRKNNQKSYLPETPEGPITPRSPSRFTEKLLYRPRDKAPRCLNNFSFKINSFNVDCIYRNFNWKRFQTFSLLFHYLCFLKSSYL